MNSKVRVLLITATLAIICVLSLYWISAQTGKVHNGFNRIIRGNVELALTLNVKQTGYYFAGFYDGRCYLGNSNTPDSLLEIANTVEHTVPIKHTFPTYLKTATILIDSPYFYVSVASSHSIYKGDPMTWTINNLVHEGKFFTEALPISQSSIVFRSLYPDKLEYLLSKESVNPNSLTEADDLLEKQIDGMFCTDGILQFDKKEALLIYTYFYRNQFIVTDTSLRLKYRGNTIDTVTRANIKISKRTSRGEITLASPPAIVNRRSCAANGKVYINSNLIADNEDSRKFNTVDVIDIYHSSNGEYQESLYLPRINGVRINHFIIHGGFLYALHDHFFTVFKLPIPSEKTTWNSQWELHP